MQETKTNNNKIEIVKDLFDAHNKRDVNRIRNHLADDFSYKSPSSQFQNADDFINALSPMLEFLDKTKIVKIVSSGDEVVVKQTTTMSKPINGINSIEAIEWYTFEGEKVKSLLFLHDKTAINTNSIEIDKKNWQETSREKNLAVA